MNDIKPLTQRQLEFLALIANGMRPVEIAELCVLSRGTVNATIDKARQRIGARNNSQAVVLAIAREELGLAHDGQCFISNRGLKQ